MKKAMTLLLALALTLSLCLPAFAADGKSSYVDVPAGDSDAAAIEAVTESGLMGGVGAGKFLPEGSVSRDQLVTVLGRLAKAVPTDAADIADVPAGTWYSGYVNWAVGKGILALDAQGKFNPKAAVTAAELETAFVALAKLLGRDYTAAEKNDSPVTRAMLAVRLEALMNAAIVIDYAKVGFDFSGQIAAELAALKLVPDAVADLTVEDANGATGVVLVEAAEAGHLNLNAYVAGNALTFSGKIASASSSLTGALTVVNGQVKVTPAAISAANPVDEVITFVMQDGKTYAVHTLNELLPTIRIPVNTVSAENAGVYHFSIDKFALSVNTAGELIYYRNFNCVGENMAEGFCKHIAADGAYYTMFVELHPEYRNANGGYSSGVYVVMDGNHKEIDYATMLPNTDPKHTHGQGYLDQHEFLVLSKGHYLNLSYTPLYVENIPVGAGTGGSATGYVWAGIFQEVKDGKVIAEINTADYPLLYESAVEKVDYAGSTDKGVNVTINNNEVFSLADGWQDYVHPNSLDYTLKADGSVDKLLISMRDQCAVYQFDMKTGAIDWILGGKASTLDGYEAYTSVRKDEAGYSFTALSYGQHYARYMNRKADGTLDGSPKISVFDNQTGTAPFFIKPPAPFMAPTLTRTFTAVINEAAGTATVGEVINGTDMNKKSEGYHIASHCGSVDYFSKSSVLIGWGLHGVVDNIGPMAPTGTIADPAGFPDLRQGSRPIFTEYDMAGDAITFELYVLRNPKISSHEALFSYRTYKTAE